MNLFTKLKYIHQTTVKTVKNNAISAKCLNIT